MRSSGNFHPLMNAAAFIRGAWPRGAAKQIERALGCSRRQAWRIASTGHVPGVFAATLLEAVRYALARNQAEIARRRAELKVIRHARMVDRARARRAPDMGPLPRVAPRPAERAGNAAVKPKL